MRLRLFYEFFSLLGSLTFVACSGSTTPQVSSQYSAAVNDQVGQLFSICGFSPISYAVKSPDSLLAKSSIELAASSCPTQDQVYCPASFSSLDKNTQFCQVERPWGVGYWWHCAPVNMDLCEPDTCDGKTTFAFSDPHSPVAAPLNWSDRCLGFENSMLAYETPDTITYTLNNNASVIPGSAFVGETTVGGVQYFYYQTKDAQYVSFRGTNTACNVLADIYAVFSKDPDLNINIHAGFLGPSREAFNCTDLTGAPLSSCKDSPKGSLSDIISAYGEPLYVSGHSLGGAVAAVFSLLVVEKLKNVKIDGITTVGQPEVTDLDGINTVNAKYISTGKYPLLRIINGYDIVPYAVKNVTSNSGHFAPEIRIGWPTSQLTGLSTDFSYYDQLGGAGYQRPAWYYSTSMVYDHLGSGYGPPMTEMGCPSFVFKAPSTQQQKARNIHLQPAHD